MASQAPHPLQLSIPKASGWRLWRKSRRWVAIAALSAATVLLVGGKLEIFLTAQPSVKAPQAHSSAAPLKPQASPTLTSSARQLPPPSLTPSNQPRTPVNPVPSAPSMRRATPQDSARIQPLARRSQQTNLGHFPYLEAQNTQMVDLGQVLSDRQASGQWLHVEAARSFQALTAAAQAEGIRLSVISGFRSHDEQRLLFEQQTSRQGSPQAAAKISAPAGHSEHHTGYALDLADATRPDTDLQVSFETTTSFAWLLRHAAEYGFELSFPRHNSQGINYEPWHWRYVGSPQANQTFAIARNRAQ
jgi:zinc D-Ala-D-Ala carboxypeptidase